MNLSIEVSALLRDVIFFAKHKRYEYITPELMLLVICGINEFADCYEECGGDIESLIVSLTAYVSEYSGEAGDADPEFSDGTNRLLAYASQQAVNSGKTEVEITHIIHAFWKLQNSYAVYYMEEQGIAESRLIQEMLLYEIFRSENDEAGEYEVEYTETAGEDPTGRESGEADWRSCAPCLNETLKDENPLIGREEEIERTIQILCRKDKNNPLHIGEPGVGKTAVTNGLVRLIREGNVPEPLKGAKVFSLDLGGLLAGTQYRGEFEKKFKKVLGAIEKEEKPIIYIDEIHNLLGAGAVGESSMDASNMLKPYLSGGHIRFIGATTFDEYKKHFEKSRSLTRRFQNVEIAEPSIDETVKILDGLKPGYESYHGVTYRDGVTEYVAKMSAKHINERFLPDKAIDLLDEAGAYRRLHADNEEMQIVDKEIVNIVLTSICRVPVESVESDDTAGLASLEERLKARVFGQDEAVSQVVNAVKFSRAGLLEEGKPLASLLFVGPTGVGKTEIAKSLAEELGVKLIRFDMSEYGEKHAVAKLIGSPAGYVGYEEGGLLTEAVRKSPSSVLLLDEIEKAHSDIYNVLLQIMDYATLTDNQGRKADFRNVIIIMTSNAGAGQLEKTGIGFNSENTASNAIPNALKKTFKPEFRNRLNKIVTFNSMDDAMGSLVVGKKLGELGELLKAKGIEPKAEESAVDLVRKQGISRTFGAREVDRVIRNGIKPLLVDEILFGRLKNGGVLILSAENDEFKVNVEI